MLLCIENDRFVRISLSLRWYYFIILLFVHNFLHIIQFHWKMIAFCINFLLLNIIFIMFFFLHQSKAFLLSWLFHFLPLLKLYFSYNLFFLCFLHSFISFTSLFVRHGTRKGGAPGRYHLHATLCIFSSISFYRGRQDSRDVLQDVQSVAVHGEGLHKAHEGSPADFQREEL